MKTLNFHRIINYLPLFIALLTLAVFLPVLRHDFINLDDPVVVYANPHVQAGLTLDNFRWAFTSDFISNWVPLTMVSHIMDVQLFGMNPAGHHAVNLFFHVSSTLLLFLTLKRATDAPYCSAAVALLFGLHPLQIESVAWISERKDVLSGFFFMLTLFFYNRYAKEKLTSNYLLVAFAFTLGLLSKPMLVTMPFILILYDYWPLRRFRNIRSKLLPLFIEKIPFFALSFAVSLVTFTLKKTRGEIVNDLSLVERVGRSFINYISYIRKVFAPSGLAVFYPSSESAPAVYFVLSSLLVILLLTFYCIKYSSKYPFLIVGWLWFIVLLLPVSGIIQSGACVLADRYTYLAVVGLFVMVIWGLSHLAKRWHLNEKGLWMAALVVLTFMLFVTSRQLRHWRNSFTLMTHAIKVTENNWLALNNIGQVYLENGDVNNALKYFEEAVKAKPTFVVALVNLGALLALNNQPDLACSFIKQSLLLDPGNEKANLLYRAMQSSCLLPK